MRFRAESGLLNRATSSLDLQSRGSNRLINQMSSRLCIKFYSTWLFEFRAGLACAVQCDLHLLAANCVGDRDYRITEAVKATICRLYWVRITEAMHHCLSWTMLNCVSPCTSHIIM